MRKNKLQLSEEDAKKIIFFVLFFGSYVIALREVLNYYFPFCVVSENNHIVQLSRVYRNNCNMTYYEWRNWQYIKQFNEFYNISKTINMSNLIFTPQNENKKK